jgi:hypothetical protein
MRIVTKAGNSNKKDGIDQERQKKKQWRMNER